MIRLGKRDAMKIVCGCNRLRLYKYDIQPDLFSKASKQDKEKIYKRMAAHQRRCGRIIKTFVRASR